MKSFTTLQNPMDPNAVLFFNTLSRTTVVSNTSKTMSLAQKFSQHKVNNVRVQRHVKNLVEIRTNLILKLLRGLKLWVLKHCDSRKKRRGGGGWG